MTPAGPEWCDRFPTSRSVDDLAEPFRSHVRAFLSALTTKGCRYEIADTYRPPERAFLMRTAWDVANGLVAPGAAPKRAGVDILWTKDGARAMCDRYALAYRPAGEVSRHCQRRALDMRIHGWTGTAAELDAFGADFGVHHLEKDPVHWSDDGA